MKVLFKILMAPVTLVLTLFVWICSAILYCSSFVFGLAGTLIGLLGLLVLISGNVQNAVILFVLAFIASREKRSLYRRSFRSFSFVLRILENISRYGKIKVDKKQ